MKQIEARVEYLGWNVYQVSIDDHDAMMATLTRTWTGWSEKDALKNANQKLNLFGYNAELNREA